jgi:thioesterase domain-containing protein
VTVEASMLDPTLVTIRPGAPTKPALFCVHAEAGDVSLYHALAHHLASERTVLGLCTPTAAVVAGEPSSLARIAACHVKTITETQPDGPHLIVGECTGGALAYEIAQQLRADGREVALLALIDAFPPGQPLLRTWMPRPLHRLLHRARIVGFHLANLARLDMPGRRAYVAAKAERARAALARKTSGARRGARDGAHSSPPGGAHSSPPGGAHRGPPDGAHRGLDHQASSGSPQLAFRNAFAAYTPTPYPGPIVVFRAARMPLGARVAPDMGWRGLAHSVEIETIPGYFTTPISEPGVRVLAARLSAHLAGIAGGW